MEILKVIFIAGIGTATITYFMVFLAIKRGYLDIEEDVEELRKRRKQAKKDKATFTINPVHNKWLYFGGGYYGLMALTTYVHAEFFEVYDFFSNFTSFSDFIEKISISAIIHLVIESFLNLIHAFLWFFYWPKVFVMQNGWIWLCGSYAGYYIGKYLAHKFDIESQFNKKKES